MNPSRRGFLGMLAAGAAALGLVKVVEAKPVEAVAPPMPAPPVAEKVPLEVKAAGPPTIYLPPYCSLPLSIFNTGSGPCEVVGGGERLGSIPAGGAGYYECSSAGQWKRV